MVDVFNTWRRTIKMGAHNCVSGFLIFGITNMSGWIIPCCGGLSDTVSEVYSTGGRGRSKIAPG